jgi:hypothetical protein
MIDKIDETGLRASLENETCQLNHGHWDSSPEENYAVDWLVIPMGFKQNEIEASVQNFLTVPICKACAETLTEAESDWTLVYCLDCSANHWVLHPIAKLDYRNAETGKSYRILWVRGCPECSKQLNGITFT